MLSQAPRSLVFVAASTLIAAFATVPASAQPVDFVDGPGAATVVCSRTLESVSCRATWDTGNGIPLVVKVLPPEDERDRASLAERVRAWESYCQPSLRYDRYGVGRYVYRVAGCEFGRSAD